MPKKQGALPYQTIVELIESGGIQGSSVENVQPASLDLTLSDEVYRVESVFKPQRGNSVRQEMRCVGPELHSWAQPLELEVTYLARLNEMFKLPNPIYGYGNPKSSSARVDVHVRMLADGINRFDSAGEPGYAGELWCLITPRSIRPKLQAGESLLQSRLLSANTRFSNEFEMEMAYRKHQFLYTPSGEPISWARALTADNDAALILTVNLDADVVGYRCEKTQKVLDWTRRDYEPTDFFQPILRPKNGSITFRKGDFYILFSNEFLKVPPEFAVEMVPIDLRAGDFRTHYAGYFDPGWGYGPNGDLKGAPAVLEVRSYEDNILIRHGEPICKMTYERMYEVPDKLYGTGSNYLLQNGPRLSKHFKQV
jgi:dCTP deaminase